MPTRKKKKQNRSNKKKKRALSRIVLILIVLGIFVTGFFLLKPVFRDFSEFISSRITQETDEETPLTVEELDPVLDAILHAVDQLGVPDELISIQKREKETNISVQLDRQRLDLNFANMIITGQAELAGAELVKGEESASGNIQNIQFRDPDKGIVYNVRLSYARVGRYPEPKPKLAIVVDDFGYFAGSLLESFNNLHIEVTFAILPDKPHTRNVMEKAKKAGREVMIHIPMEPLNYPSVNPGPNPILVNLSEREIRRRMEQYIRQLPYASGANNHMGSLATSDRNTMEIVLDVLKKHSLFFVDSRTSGSSIAHDLAQEMNVLSARRDLFLDSPDVSERTFQERLSQLKQLKARQDSVLIITHCFDEERLDHIQRLIYEAEKMGFEIVRVSRLFETGLPEIL